MKKFLAVVMTAVLAMSMMTACGSSKSSKENKDTTAQRQKQHRQKQSMHRCYLVSDGVLTVGAEMGYAPFETLQKDGKTPEDLILILLQKLLRD